MGIDSNDIKISSIRWTILGSWGWLTAATPAFEIILETKDGKQYVYYHTDEWGTGGGITVYAGPLREKSFVYDPDTDTWRYYDPIWEPITKIR